VNTCRHCKAEVLWVRTAATGRPMPLDPDESERGNVFVEYAADGSGMVCHVASKANPRPPGIPHMPHWATCPVLNKPRPIPAAKPEVPPAPEPMSLFDQGEPG
jgi:hypothetical protein